MLAVICAGVSYGQGSTVKKKVAVYVTGSNDVSITKILGSKITEAIIKNGKFSAVERTDAILSMLRREQTYQRSGNVDDSQIGKLGRELGVHYVAIAEIVEAFGTKYVSARLVDTELAEVVAFGDVYGDINNMLSLITMSEKVAEKLLGGRLGDNNALYMTLENYGFMVMKRDLGNATSHSAESMCKGSRLGGFSDWRLPNQSELAILYVEKNLIGGFVTDSNNNPWYWSSAGDNIFFWMQNFSSGIQVLVAQLTMHTK